LFSSAEVIHLPNPRPAIPGVLLLSGGDAPAARLLAKDTGHLLWETPLNISLTVQPDSPPPMVKSHDADFVVLVHPVLIRLDGETGDIKWKYDALQTG
jgi:outer membrane protein assembly factor BamB